MANLDIRKGFTPVGADGGPYQGRLRSYRCSASDAIYIGDMMKLSGDMDSKGRNLVVAATAGDTPIGPVVAILPNKDFPEEQLYKKAGDTVDLLIADSPDALLEVQCGNGTFATTDANLNGDLIYAEGSTVTGRSRMELDHSTLNTTNSLVFHVVEIVKRDDNEVGENVDVLVSYNVHARKGGITQT